jgi:hypothetical protein
MKRFEMDTRCSNELSGPPNGNIDMVTKAFVGRDRNVAEKRGLGPVIKIKTYGMILVLGNEVRQGRFAKGS